MEDRKDVGLIGLGVMGQNLALNIQEHGHQMVVFNRTTAKMEAYLEGPAKGSGIVGVKTLKELVSLLERPRKLILMVQAGKAVDFLIDDLLPLLEEGDILIDGGNSHYEDTDRRCEELANKGILFVGAGISGGEEGARFGPSIMPGGNEKAWPHISSMLRDISARSEEGDPCCDWVGRGGSGHYVKMIHNGIEYGDMQIICEAYDLLKRVLGCKAEEMAHVFSRWNGGALNSYLIEITSTIFAETGSDGAPLVDKILDRAQQKGTGKWTALSAIEQGIPLTLILEAVCARNISSQKTLRETLSSLYSSSSVLPYDAEEDREGAITDMESALYGAKIISYAQGFSLLKSAGEEKQWELNYGSIALMWRGGCIIRSRFLQNIKEAYEGTPSLEHLLLDPFFQEALLGAQEGWRRSVCLAASRGIPAPCLSSALSFFDAMRSSTLPANLLQGQRDFFGAHTYERIDRERGRFFHNDWIGGKGEREV